MCKIYSSLDNAPSQFEWCDKNLSIHELRTFGCDIYPITTSPKKLYEKHRNDHLWFTPTTKLK